MTTTERTTDEIGLTVINEADFYHQYAAPLLSRHRLLLTASNYPDLRPYMQAEWELLAEYALDFWNYRLIKKLDLERVWETPELLIKIAQYLQAHYTVKEFTPQKCPYGGDLIKSVPEWSWGSFGIKPERPYGVLGGADGYENMGGSITFNASAFRGKSSKYATGPVHVSCSGGPATIWTDTEGFKFAGYGDVCQFWRWPGTPQAHTAKYYCLAVPVWFGDLN